MDNVIVCIMRLGKESLIVNMDIKQAYCNVPIHPDDHLLLGMKWQDQVFVDKALPFGLRSAPLIFTALADCLQWIMQRRGADPLFHYLDDFLTVGRPQSDQCASNLQIMKQACSDTGTPIEPDKCKGPSYSTGGSGARARHRKAGDAASPGQAARPTGGTVILQGKESLQEEGVALPHQLTFSRLQSS